MRYFLEVAYKGTGYRGFQVQQNALTVQGEIEKAFQILFSSSSPSEGVKLTGSSRTDSGVHACQNFFHFDWPDVFQQKWIYNLNAILPGDIVIKNVIEVSDHAHCRFDALNRTYHYHIYQYKNPFIADRAYHYPYTLDFAKLSEAASLIKGYTDFTSFSKRNTQVKTFNCNILESEWIEKDEQLIYIVSANRFLRGMVRALTATMLKVGRGIISIESFHDILESKDCTKAYFDTPAHGLTLKEVRYQ
ncbi:tRNA pseudouridine(38-40) synthase TruA [Niabella ginsengisoli]|uniref:tRNA pseudouridine synthase A n=1 Tax=Niabella ginsengisoli TaxID=522298 RepID=A0ABS9SGF0_9BACT|nr:tRNA pseudouridine(38-40) synthase TruA [Niabella ginsengisoli]MCH5597436.1 tRNA pseudouridine(38-40) synthase TruA [Niabella ginsengisoli]